MHIVWAIGVRSRWTGKVNRVPPGHMMEWDHYYIWNGHTGIHAIVITMGTGAAIKTTELENYFASLHCWAKEGNNTP